MANSNVPNDASEKSKAEGGRWKSDSETVERYDRTVDAQNEDLVRRTSKERDDTPRRYEQPAEDDDVMP